VSDDQQDEASFPSPDDLVIQEFLKDLETASDREAVLREHAARHPHLADEFADQKAMQDRLDHLKPQAAGIPNGLPAVFGSATARSGEAEPIRVRYFGDYEITDVIGRGNMGVVFQARQVSLNRVVALKMILSGQLADETDVRRFYAEAEAAANLDHPGIVHVYEVGQHDGQHYFSMGFVDGRSLAQQLASGPLPSREAAVLMAKVADAIEFAHHRGVIHRDLKPANILLDARGEPYVTDFGLAKRVVDDGELTHSGAIVGTPAYMAPEQASGRRGAVTTSSDVYGLGAILYALLTGRAPFQERTVLDILDRVRTLSPLAPSKINPQTSRDLEVICLKCLEKDPVRRYPSAQALADDLRRYLADKPILARPVGTPRRAWMWCRRNKGISALGALLTLSLVAGSVFSLTFALRARDESRRANKEAGIASQQATRASEAKAKAEAQLDVNRELLITLGSLFTDYSANEMESLKTVRSYERMERAEEKMTANISGGSREFRELMAAMGEASATHTIATSDEERKRWARVRELLQQRTVLSGMTDQAYQELRASAEMMAACSAARKATLEALKAVDIHKSPKMAMADRVKTLDVIVRDLEVSSQALEAAIPPGTPPPSEGSIADSLDRGRRALGEAFHAAEIGYLALDALESNRTVLRSCVECLARFIKSERSTRSPRPEQLSDGYFALGRVCLVLKRDESCFPLFAEAIRLDPKRDFFVRFKDDTTVIPAKDMDVWNEFYFFIISQTLENHLYDPLKSRVLIEDGLIALDRRKAGGAGTPEADAKERRYFDESLKSIDFRERERRSWREIGDVERLDRQIAFLAKALVEFLRHNPPEERRRNMECYISCERARCQSLILNLASARTRLLDSSQVVARVEEGFRTLSRFIETGGRSAYLKGEPDFRALFRASPDRLRSLELMAARLNPDVPIEVERVLRTFEDLKEMDAVFPTDPFAPE
jgi:serine/threonine protein kinase